MSNKLASYKLKWSIAGLISGILLTLYLPQIFVPKRSSNEQNTQSTIVYNKFTDYSKWPPFLTDSSFDIV